MIEIDAFREWLATLPSSWTVDVDVKALRRANAEYGEPVRAYHNWTHVEACVDSLRTLECAIPRAVFLAIVFHDAVYVTGKSDNEGRSAAFAHDALASSTLPKGELASIERMILATRNHHASGAALEPDEQLMLDIDLGILGASRPAYERYAAAIHDEYCPTVTTDAIFRMGRLSFLRNALAMPRIYFGDETRARWEASARGNLAWEIDELVGQQGLLERGISAIRDI